MKSTKYIIGLTVFLCCINTSVSYADDVVNINTADKVALMTLTGIGEVKAQAIIDYRTEYGPFATKEDILKVSGIGPATFENIKDRITVGGGAQSQTTSLTTSSSNTNTGTSESSQGTTASSPSSATTLRISAGGDRAVFVGIDVPFDAIAQDSSGRAVEAHYRWNFGDGSAMDGKHVAHRFEYPGKYAVVLEVVSRQGLRATHQVAVTVESAQLNFKALPDGSVSIENLASRDVDLSQWKVAQGASVFVLAQHTIALKNSTVRLSPATLGFRATSAATLLYPDGRIAPNTVPVETTTVQAESSLQTASNTSTSAAALFSYEDTSEPPDDIAAVAKASSSHVQESHTPITYTASAAAVIPSDKSLLFWIGLLAIIGCGALALFAVRRMRMNTRKGWTIIEDTSE